MRDGNDSRLGPLTIGYAGRIAPERRQLKALGGQYGEPLFCSSCGCLEGFVTVDLPPGVFEVCGPDNGCGHDCGSRYKGMPGMTPVPYPPDFRGV